MGTTLSSSNSTTDSVNDEVPSTIETNEYVWVMVEAGMGIVIWEVGKGEEMFWITDGSEVEERFEMKVSGNGMQMFAARSDDEGNKIRSWIDDDERMNQGNCRGTFKDWVSAIVDGSMGCRALLAGIEIDV